MFTFFTKTTADFSPKDVLHHPLEMLYHSVAIYIIKQHYIFLPFVSVFAKVTFLQMFKALSKVVDSKSL